MLSLVQNLYSIFDQIHLTTSAVITLSLFLLIGLILTAREAVAWFLKMHDLKNELARIHSQLSVVEEHLRNLEEGVTRKQAAISDKKKPSENLSMPGLQTPPPIKVKMTARSEEHNIFSMKQNSTVAKERLFPIQH